MSRCIALEWDLREIRMAIALPRGRQLVLQEAVSLPLEDSPAARAPAAIGARIREALEQRGIRRGEALVCIGRGQIELRQMSLPPAPEAELPEMVRLTAMRQFAHLGDNWPLDFVPLPGGGEEGVSVLAAALAPQQLEPIRQVCAAAQLELKHLVLRPFAAAALLGDRPAAGDSEGTLLVDLLAEEADLSVLVAGTPVLLRTVKLAADPASRPAALLGEIRRTLAAARNQLAGRGIEQAVLLGAAGEHDQLAAQLESEMRLRAERRDPFSLLRDLVDELSRVPENPGRFAPLLGLLQTEAAEGRHAIDFLSPRRAPEPVDTRRRKLMIAGGAAAVLALVVLLPLWRLWSLDWEAARLEGELKTLESSRERVSRVEKELAEIDKWATGDLVWLEEFKVLCERLPPAEEVILSQLVAAARPEGGQWIAEGAASDSSVIPKLERSLTAPGYTVRGSGAQEDPRGSEYRYRFQEAITILPPEERPRPAESPPATAATSPARTGVEGGTQ